MWTIVSSILPVYRNLMTWLIACGLTSFVQVRTVWTEEITCNFDKSLVSEIRSRFPRITRILHFKFYTTFPSALSDWQCWTCKLWNAGWLRERKTPGFRRTSSLDVPGNRTQDNAIALLVRLKRLTTEWWSTDNCPTRQRLGRISMYSSRGERGT